MGAYVFACVSRQFDVLQRDNRVPIQVSEQLPALSAVQKVEWVRSSLQKRTLCIQAAVPPLV